MKNCLGLLSLAALLVAAGCDDGADGVGGDANGASNAGGDTANGAGNVGGESAGGDNAGGNGTGGNDDLDWQTIIDGDWSLDPFSENTSDLHTVVIAEDLYIGAIRPIAPQGTHHTVLAIGDLGAGNVVYASGVGTNAIVFPPGVGLKVAAGESLILQLHLFNPSGEPITGNSGIQIVEIAPEDVEYEADLLLPGPTDLSIPPNQTSTATGSCTVGSTQSFFAIIPHMHQLGTHLKTTVTIGGETTTLYDDAYSFNDQAFVPFTTITLNQGDTIDTECTFNNTTAMTVGWGESSNTEMCFSIMYRYPKVDDGGFFSFCDN